MPTIPLKSGVLTPDGSSASLTPVFPKRERKAFKAFLDLKNEVGAGSCDPTAQAECGFVAVYASDEYKPLRAVSCCPTFLIGILGPYIAVSSAVFADNFILERLTDYIFIGPKSTTAKESTVDGAIMRVAQLFRTLKTCLEDLDVYYSWLQPSPSPPRRTPSPLVSSPNTPPPSFVHPHFNEYTVDGTTFKLTYTRRLVSHYKEKAVFKATAQATDPASEPRTVVVKFTPRYGHEGHKLLAAAKFAPELLFCEIVESVGMYVVIMEFLEGQRVQAPIESSSVGTLREAIKILHKTDFVFGDLREPNILQTDQGIMLIDFDWCGKVGEAFYPRAIYLGGEISWHRGICRGGRIEKEHDIHMLSLLETP